MSIAEFSSKYKVPALVLVLWIMTIVTFVIFQAFIDITKLTMPVASAVGAVIGLPSLAAGLIKWRSDPPGTRQGVGFLRRPTPSRFGTPYYNSNEEGY